MEKIKMEICASACLVMLISLLASDHSFALPTTTRPLSPTTDAWRTPRNSGAARVSPRNRIAGFPSRHNFGGTESDWQQILDSLRLQAEAQFDEDLSGELVTTEDDSAILHDQANYLNSDEEFEAFIRQTATAKEARSPKRPSIGTASPSRDDVAKDLPSSEPVECPICMSAINPKRSIYDPMKLKCGHSFHYVCLKNWFTASNRRTEIKQCPICRKEYTHMTLMDHVQERDRQHRQSSVSSATSTT